MSTHQQQQQQSSDAQHEFSLVASSRRFKLREYQQRKPSDDNIIGAYRKTMLTAQTEQEVAGSGSTMILHEEQNGKPAITLTTYSFELPERPALELRSSLWKPDGSACVEKTQSIELYLDSQHSKHDQPFSEHIGLVFDHTQSRDTTAALEKLRNELNQHFERLKREYEGRTGRSWMPLRPWSREQWDWIDDMSSLHELGEGDWLGDRNGNSV